MRFPDRSHSAAEAVTQMKRLLIVEDHPWVLQRVCASFRQSGAHLGSATSLREARNCIAHDDPYDLIVCEQHLSDGTGLEFLAWLRWQNRIQVPFLLIVRDEEFASCYEENFSVLARPFRPTQLLRSLNRLLRDETHGMIACQIPFAAAAS